MRGSSIITVAGTLPRGATSLLSSSFSPPKLLILKSACEPFPPNPPLPSHRPSQPRDDGLPPPPLRHRARPSPAPSPFYSSQSAVRRVHIPAPVFPLASTRGRGGGDSQGGDTHTPPHTPPRSAALSCPSAPCGDAAARGKSKKDLGIFRPPRGFPPSTGTGGLRWDQRLRSGPRKGAVGSPSLPPPGKPRERWAKTRGRPRPGPASASAAPHPSPARPRPLPAPRPSQTWCGAIFSPWLSLRL